MSYGLNDYESTRGEDGRFGRGNPGRQLGSQNRIPSRVAQRILHDFEENADEIMREYRKDLRLHVRYMAMVMPRAQYLDLNHYDALGLEDPRIPGDALLREKTRVMEAEIRAFRLEEELRELKARYEAAERELVEAGVWEPLPEEDAAEVRPAEEVEAAGTEADEDPDCATVVQPFAAAVDLGLRRVARADICGESTVCDAGAERGRKSAFRPPLRRVSA